jgi:outer membrane protein assembly factor BamB
MKAHLLRFSLANIFALAVAAVAPAADWPMWRFDAQRSAASPTPLPAQLHLHWSREYPAEIPAWPEQEKMPFDVCYEPIVVGQTLYMNSSRHDCIRALDVASGERKWIFFADGPIRFAPLHHNGKLYFTADDGHLYCLHAESGELLWKIRGGPSDRRILGNQRIISTWPGRGAPVIADGTLYFAASIWPFMGVFIHAVEPETGRIFWTNDGDGSTYMKQPHSTDAFASVAPQGPLAVDKDYLVIPGGRSIPAVFDRKTGKLLRLPLADNGKLGGGSEVTTFGNVYFNGGAVFELATSKFQGYFGKRVAATRKAIFAYDNGALKAFNPATYKLLPTKSKSEAGTAAAEDKDSPTVKAVKETKTTTSTKPTRWRIDELASIATPPLEALISAGTRVYGGGDNFIMAFDFNAKTKTFDVVWQTRVNGKVARLIAGADRLFAATNEGQLYCFAEGEVTPRHHSIRTTEVVQGPADVTKQALTLLEAGGAREGYAVSWGYGDGALVTELVHRSKLQMLALEPSAAKAFAGRRAQVAFDFYGTRLAILPGDPRQSQLPPYFCSVIFATELKSAGVTCDEEFLHQAFSSLRPFGGKLVLAAADVPTGQQLEEWAKKIPQANVRRLGDIVVVSRDGPIPGSANWTHEHADSSNTRVSKDVVVKAPMGLLWFGGPSHEGILPRHGHGPQPQVVDGRIILEGVDMMRALDIYTGRLLWETKLPGVGDFFNNLAHQAGANASGGNFVCASDGIYVAWKNNCVMLDPETGVIKRTFTLPPSLKPNDSLRWGYLNIDGDYLIGGAEPVFDEKNLPPKNPAPGFGDDDNKSIVSKSLSKVVAAMKPFSDNMSASRRLVVMDRHSGKILWQTSANYTFRHNGTCVGGGRLYTVDRLPSEELAKRRTATDDLPKPYRVVAFNLKNGERLWETDDDVFGTWLSYSAKYDILVEAGRVARDTLKDEPRGVRALEAKSGKELWFQKAYAGPAMIHGDEILLEAGACDLRTGGLKLREDPITGDPVPWKWIRTYGCNTPAASEHLLTFRSGAAGYFDLCNDGGTGNFGGFRSSCTNNLIVAGGILTVPEYTRTCTCNYQNQTSVALIHMPDAEMWTYFGTKEIKGPIKRLGVNLGAVGDRRADDGTLWLEYPSTGGVSPTVAIGVKPSASETYRRFSGIFTGPYNWVASSGLRGEREVTIPVGLVEGKKSRRFTVRLVFAEPDLVEPGQRIFNVDVQGERKLRDFDIVREAGGSRRSLIREFRSVAVGERLTVRISASSDGSLPPVLSGIEVIEETSATP